jgi:hypothetical protein
VLAARNQPVIEENRALAATNEQLAREIEHLRSIEAKKLEAETQREAFCSDVGKFENLITELERHKKCTLASLDDSKAELQSLGMLNDRDRHRV